MDRDEVVTHPLRQRQPFRPLRRLEGGAAPALEAIRKPPALASSDDFCSAGWGELALDEDPASGLPFKLP